MSDRTAELRMLLGCALHGIAVVIVLVTVTLESWWFGFTLAAIVVVLPKTLAHLAG